jgi:hypothetical protein
MKKETDCVDYCDGRCGYLYEPIVDDFGYATYPEMPKCPGTDKCNCYNRPISKNPSQR